MRAVPDDLAADQEGTRGLAEDVIDRATYEEVEERRAARSAENDEIDATLPRFVQDLAWKPNLV